MADAIKPGEKPPAIGGRTWKVPPVPVPSDDCVVYQGKTYKDDPKTGKKVVDFEGTPAYWHVGERVWLLPLTNMDAYFSVLNMGDVNEMELDDPRRPKVMQGAFEEQAEALSRYLAGWDWTDLASEPLPQPYKNPAVLRQLDSDEFTYLLNLVMTGPAKTEGNGSGPSPDTSSTTGPLPERPSSAGSAKRSTAPRP